MDEAVTLLVDADGTWQSLHAEGRTWEDRAAARGARRGSESERGGAGPRPRRGDALAPAIGEREQRWELWRASGVLLRSEYEIGRELVTVVAQGPRWWRWSPSLGTSSGGGAGRPARLVVGPVAALLEGARFADAAEFLGAARTEVAKRAAISLKARLSGRGREVRATLRDAGSGADEYHLDVDAERGVLLGVTASRGGSPFRRVEMTSVVFDGRFAANLFSPPSGFGDAPAAEPARRLSVADLAASLGFAMFLPDPNPSGVAPHVALVRGDRNGPGPARGLVTYPMTRNGRRGQLRVQLTKEEPAPSPRERWTVEGDVIVSEEQLAGIVRRRVRARREGTFVELESAILERDELVDLARSLRRVETGAPG